MRLAWAVVTAVTEQRPGLQRLTANEGGRERGALCYPQLTGSCEAGDVVLLNTTAADMGLGTGGTDFVVARRPRDVEGDVALDQRSGGHIMKLRYTPLQVDVIAVEAPESPWHDTMSDASDVGGMPVVCCGLHSQLPVVAAALKEAAPQARVAYAMTDEAAMPIALSDVVSSALAAGLIDETVTCGQAFGGGLEAVNLHSGLLAARHVAGADAVIVAIGPGVAGTGTPFGHGGVAQGEALNAAAAVGGRPVVPLRLSFADERERHRGVSHHSLVALTRIALAKAIVAVPSLPADRASAVEEELERAGVWERHVRADVASAGLPDTRGVEVRTMGRGPEQDAAFFAAAAAAGTVAARLLERGVAP